MSNVQGFKRVSGVIWSFATLLSCWLVYAAFHNMGTFIGLLSLPVLGVPFALHKMICWFLDGFAPTPDQQKGG